MTLDVVSLQRRLAQAGVFHVQPKRDDNQVGELGIIPLALAVLRRGATLLRDMTVCPRLCHDNILSSEARSAELSTQVGLIDRRDRSIPTIPRTVL